MRASRQVVGQMIRIGAAIGTLFPAAAEAVHGQVGFTSQVATVALVAHVAPWASLHEVGEGRETGRVGAIREVSVRVGLTSNTGYQLSVRPTGTPAPRIWVRAASGDFQELTAGSAVTVARDARCAGQCEREVQYRIEMPDAAQALGLLPVRYEIAINPTL